MIRIYSNTRSFCIGFLLAIHLTACTSLKELPPIKAFHSSLTNFSISSEVIFHEGNNTQVLITTMELWPDKIAFAALNPLGITLFNGLMDAYTKNILSIKTPLLPVTALSLVSEIQLAYLSDTSLQPSLPEGWVMETQNNQRVLLYKNKPQVIISYDNPATLIKLNQKIPVLPLTSLLTRYDNCGDIIYTLTIKTLSVNQLL